MKRISCFLLLSTLLASCATSARYSFGSVVTPTPVVTEINAPTATAVFTPTSQPTPTLPETTAFLVDALTIAPEQAAAMRAHSGLEASITAEAEGKFSTTVQVLNTQGQPVTETMQVDPNTLHEDLASKNKYGDTPVMTTIDGKKLYWIQEEKAWFAVEISPDIHAPLFVPFNQREVALRVTIAEFSQPFSQAAVERWKTSSGLMVGFQYLQTSAQPGGTRFGFLTNRSMTETTGLSVENAHVQVLDAWFTTSLPDGTTYQFYPTKWFDPTNPKNPDPNDWKIIFAASGQEIMGDEGNREKFDALLARAAAGDNHVVVPIVTIQPGFFDSTNGLITFGTAQPSLEALLRQPGNTINKFIVPNRPGDKFDFWLTYLMDQTSPTNPGMGFYFETNQDDAYKTQFFPPEFQTILYPALVTLQ